MLPSDKKLAKGSRQLLYRAASFDIDFRFDATGKMCRVSGKIFPTPLAGTAEIFTDLARQTVAVTTSGEFVFSPVRRGKYNFEFHLDQTHIKIPDVLPFT